MVEEEQIILEPQGFTPLEVAGIKWFLRREGRIRVMTADVSSNYEEKKGKIVRLTPEILGSSAYEHRLMEILSPWLNEEEECGEQLSSREKEVLTLLANGLSNKEVADRLCISLNTVITHRRNLSAKLGIKSLAGLTLYAYLHDLI